MEEVGEVIDRVLAAVTARMAVREQETGPGRLVDRGILEAPVLADGRIDNGSGKKKGPSTGECAGTELARQVTAHGEETAYSPDLTDSDMPAETVTPASDSTPGVGRVADEGIQSLSPPLEMNESTIDAIPNKPEPRHRADWHTKPGPGGIDQVAQGLDPVLRLNGRVRPHDAADDLNGHRTAVGELQQVDEDLAATVVVAHHSTPNWSQSWQPKPAHSQQSGNRPRLTTTCFGLRDNADRSTVCAQKDAPETRVCK